MSKTALVTGGAGFIGHHIIEHFFKNTDWNIICLDRLDTSGNLNRIAEILDGNPLFKPRFRFVYHDLKAELNSTVRNDLGKINYIFHLAASSHVDRSITDPLMFVNDNVVGTCNILNYARGVDSLEYFQNFSTDEVFGDAAEGEAFSEWDRHKPRNPYAATKSGADQLCYAFFNTYRLPIVNTNCMNVIGERQHSEKFLPMCIKKVLNNQKVLIHADSSKTKPGKRFYIHARNVAAACLFLHEKGIFGERYNLVGQVELDNLELAQRIAEIIGNELQYELVDFHSSRPGHDLRYALEDTKLKAMGFEYPIGFEESLRRTIWWTLSNRRWLC